MNYVLTELYEENGQYSIMKKCLVTGAAGFIGSHLTDLLLTTGYQVIGIDNLAVGRLSNLSKAFDNPNFSFYELSVTDRLAMIKITKDVDCVIHLAAMADIVPSIENPEVYYDTNVNGTYNVLEAARQAGVSRFIYAASSSCYGIPDTYPTAEDCPKNPMYPYALTKMLGEELVLHWAQTYNMPAMSLRFFNVFGPRARTSGTYGAVFGVFMAQKLADQPYTVVGDGTQTRDFTYVSDIADALLVALQSNIVGEAINIGSAGSYSVNDLVSLLGGEAIYIPERPGEPKCTYADISKAQNLLNWSPKVPFKKGVNILLSHIEEFADAPLWDNNSIEKATESWFKYLGPEKDK